MKPVDVPWPMQLCRRSAKGNVVNSKQKDYFSMEMSGTRQTD